MVMELEGEDSASKRAWRTAESLVVRLGLAVGFGVILLIAFGGTSDIELFEALGTYIVLKGM